MQITPAEKIALVCDPTRAMNDINKKIIVHAEGDGVFTFGFSIDVLLERQSFVIS